MPAEELTPRQARFVEEYLVDLNAAAAARRCGYDRENARQQGHYLLTNPDIRAAIAAGIAARSERTQVTADNVLRELARVGFSDMRHVASWGGGKRLRVKPSRRLSQDDAAAVAEVRETPGRYGPTVSVKLHPKLPALEALAKHLGLLQAQELNAVEVLLGALPPDLARSIRAALAAGLPAAPAAEPPPPAQPG